LTITIPRCVEVSGRSLLTDLGASRSLLNYPAKIGELPLGSFVGHVVIVRGDLQHSVARYLIMKRPGKCAAFFCTGSPCVTQNLVGTSHHASLN
jgi:hypothetical protein